MNKTAISETGSTRGGVRGCNYGIFVLTKEHPSQRRLLSTRPTVRLFPWASAGLPQPLLCRFRTAWTHAGSLHVGTECQGTPAQERIQAECFQLQASCQRGTLQGEVPPCSAFPIAASSPWGHIPCHSLYDFVGWEKERRVVKQMLSPQRVASGRRKISTTLWITNDSKCIEGKVTKKCSSNSVSSTWLPCGCLLSSGVLLFRVHENEQMCL